MAALVRYEMDELGFDVPDGFVDESVNVLVAASATARNASVVITREPRTDASLPDQVMTILSTAQEKVPGLKVLGHREREVGTVPAYEARSHAVTNKMPTYQRQVYVTWYGTLLSFTVTTPRAQSTYCDSVIERLAASLRLRKKA